MGIWNRRKKYSIENEKTGKEEKNSIKVKTTKLIRRELYLTMVSILGVTMVILGSTYAIFSSVSRSKAYNVINIGTLEITYDDTSEGLGDIINLNNAYPGRDPNADPYKFKIKNVGTLGVDYVVKIVDDQAMIDADGCADNLIPKSALRYNINYSGGQGLLSDAVDSIIFRGTLLPGETKSNLLWMWIDENAGNEVLGKHFHGKVVIETGSIVSNVTPEECFTIDATGAITGYKCYSGNSDGLATIVDVVIPSTIGGTRVTSIGDSAFKSKGIEKVVIPNGVTTIGDSAFAFDALTDLVLPDSVTTIGNTAFKANQLLRIDFSSNLESIGNNAFEYSRLSTLSLPDKLTTVGDYAFSTQEITQLVIPASVTSIGNNAFASGGDGYTTSVTILGKRSPADFIKFGTNVFYWATGYSDANIIWQP